MFCEFKIVRNENKNTKLKNLINCLLLTFYWEITNIEYNEIRAILKETKY
jgi:hypothetical protein